MADETRDPRVLEPGRAPTPFTANEIRDGCPAGRTIRLRVDVVGETPFLRVSRFVECDEAGATFERSRLSLDGSPLVEPEVDRVSWRDLQAHASFTADDTTIESERIATAIGELDCLRYTVRDGETEQLFWFAKDLPGMPIQYLTRTNGQVVTTVCVVDNTIREQRGAHSTSNANVTTGLSNSEARRLTCTRHSPGAGSTASAA